MADDQETLEIEINNEKFVVPKKFAEYLDGKQKEIKDDYAKFNSQIRQLNEELKEKRMQTKDKEKDDSDDSDDSDDEVDSLMFTNPKKAIKKITETIRETIHNDISTKSSQENARAQFWTEFYKENKDLNKNEDSNLVEFLFSKNYDDFSNKTVEQVIKELGDLSRKEILKISRRFNKQDNDNDENRSIEPVLSISKREDKYKRHNNDDEADFDSISEVIKKRRIDKLNSKMR